MTAAELSEHCTIQPRAYAVTDREVTITGDSEEPAQKVRETIFLIDAGDPLTRDFDPQKVLMEKLGACLVNYCPNAPFCQALVTRVGEKMGIGVISVSDPENFPNYQAQEI